MIISDFNKLLAYKKRLRKNKKYLLDEFVEIAKIEDEKVIFALLFFVLSKIDNAMIQVLYTFFNNSCCFKNLSTEYKTTSLQYKTFCRKIDELIAMGILFKEKFGSYFVITVNPDLYLQVIGEIEKYKKE